MAMRYIIWAVWFVFCSAANAEPIRITGLIANHVTASDELELEVHFDRAFDPQSDYLAITAGTGLTPFLGKRIRLDNWYVANGVPEISDEFRIELETTTYFPYLVTTEDKGIAPYSVLPFAFAATIDMSDLIPGANWLGVSVTVQDREPPYASDYWTSLASVNDRRWLVNTPEPSNFSLASLGFLGLLVRRRRPG
jgi:hypothetical protein